MISMPRLLLAVLNRTLLALAITIGCMSVSLSAHAAAAPAPQAGDSAYGYVSKVFDKLQDHWEQQAFNSQVADSVLTFQLDNSGNLLTSTLDAGSVGNPSAQEVQAFLKQNAPFGPFPSTLGDDSQLEFKIRLSQGSIQMLGYELQSKQKQAPMVTYAAPASVQPVSLFYARALPTTLGKVMETPSKQVSSDEQAMSDYIAQVQEQVRRNWRLAEDYRFQRVIATLMIDRDGTLLGAHLKQSSGDKLVDKAALNAIYTAGNFPQAPSNVKSLPVTIDYIFDPVLVEQ